MDFRPDLSQNIVTVTRQHFAGDFTRVPCLARPGSRLGCMNWLADLTAWCFWYGGYCDITDENPIHTKPLPAFPTKP